MMGKMKEHLTAQPKRWHCNRFWTMEKSSVPHSALTVVQIKEGTFNEVAALTKDEDIVGVLQNAALSDCQMFKISETEVATFASYDSLDALEQSADSVKVSCIHNFQ